MIDEDRSDGWMDVYRDYYFFHVFLVRLFLP
jgi:hypothetical protein